MPDTAEPYCTTPVFTHETLPQALRAAHSTKPGVWGLLRVIEGSLLYTIEDNGKTSTLTAPAIALIVPEQLHSVEPCGAMAMQVEFYRERPTVLILHERAP